jgi:hypothetical protein
MIKKFLIFNLFNTKVLEKYIFILVYNNTSACFSLKLEVRFTEINKQNAHGSNVNICLEKGELPND